jgi:hypothetical protein
MKNVKMQKRGVVLGCLVCLVSYLPAQSYFEGTLAYTMERVASEKLREGFLFLNREGPLERYLKGRLLYTISKDTLILEFYDQEEECYMVNVQIEGRTYTRSLPIGAAFVDVSAYDPDIAQISEWQRVEGSKAEGVTQFQGGNGTTQYSVEVRSDLQFAQATAPSGLFAKVFHPEGLICYSKRQSLSEETTLRLLDNGLKVGKVDCKAKLNKWLFYP